MVAVKLPTMALRAVDGLRYLKFYEAATAAGKNHIEAAKEAEDRLKEIKAKGK